MASGCGHENYKYTVIVHIPGHPTKSNGRSEREATTHPLKWPQNQHRRYPVRSLAAEGWQPFRMDSTTAFRQHHLSLPPLLPLMQRDVLSLSSYLPLLFSVSILEWHWSCRLDASFEFVTADGKINQPFSIHCFDLSVILQIESGVVTGNPDKRRILWAMLSQSVCAVLAAWLEWYAWVTSFGKKLSLNLVLEK